MNHEDRPQTVRITAQELEQVVPRQVPRRVLRPRPSSEPPPSYGHVAPQPVSRAAGEKASIFFHSWFYLGFAGLIGSLAAWAVAEFGFSDGPIAGWGNVWLMPMVVSFLCVALAVIESLIERSRSKALRHAAMSLLLGAISGFVLDHVANAIYNYGLRVSGAGAANALSVKICIARGVGWAVIGIAGGIAYGIVGQSTKKAVYGAAGGALGAALGGLIFDPISLVTHGGAPSRAIGLGLLGFATGSAMGLIESALKNRWLYVTEGPLAGKQFILYKEHTIVGSNQSADIYLFKDPNIEPDHAIFELRASCLYLRANGEVYVSGQRVRGEQILDNGAEIQVARYRFRYQEKER